MELDSARFALRECIGEVSKGMSVWAQQKGLELACKVDSKAPEALVGNPRPLRQMLINLVGNVIKFIEQGKVVISVRCLKKNSKQALLHVMVSGPGIGNPPRKEQTICESLGPAGDSTTSTSDGVVSDFAIYEGLVSLMGGRIWLEDGVLRRRSAFHFTASFAIDQQGAAALAVSRKAQLPGLEILLADDNRLSQIVAVRLLEHLGHRVSVVQDGREALEAATRMKFDLVFMDLQMPEMDGVTAAAAIRNAEKRDGPRLPIIALTVHTSDEDKKRCMDVGMDAFVCKPINSWDLLNSIESVRVRARR